MLHTAQLHTHTHHSCCCSSVQRKLLIWTFLLLISTVGTPPTSYPLHVCVPVAEYSWYLILTISYYAPRLLRSSCFELHCFGQGNVSLIPLPTHCSDLMRCLTPTLHVNCSLHTVLGGYCLFWSYPPVYLHVYQSVSLNCYFPPLWYWSLHFISPVSREVIDNNWGQICCDRAHVTRHVTAGHSSCSWSGRCCSSCSCRPLPAACSCTPASLTHHCMQIENIVLNSVKMWIFLYLNLSPAVLIAVSPDSPVPPSPPPSPGHIQPLHYSSPLTLPPRSCSANQKWKLQTAMNAELTRIWRCREGGQSSQVFDPNFYDPLCSTFNLIWKSIFSLKVAALSATLVLSCWGESGLKSEIKWRDQNNDKLFGFAKMIPSTILGLKIVQTATAAARRENVEF